MIKFKTAVFLVLLASLLSFVAGKKLAQNPQNSSEVKSLSVENIYPTIAIRITSPVTSTTSPMSYESVKVSRVIDGDTVELSDGRRVRYIGIDTPETGDPRRGVQCYGREAYEKNRELVEGKMVELEKDVSETDKYGRFLRYVYINNVLVNELLVEEGYAYSSSYPPDVKYQDNFLEAQKLAREENKGLWGSTCSNAPTANTLGISGGGFACDCDKSCKDIASCEEAQFQLKTCGCKNRDGDGDGIACDGAPLSCQY